jgi:N-succinyldiaminopimelate aminotransferase
VLDVPVPGGGFTIATVRQPFLNARLQGFGTTIFAEMSALAVATGSVNLGQGFPDTDGPDVVKQAAMSAIAEGRGNQYPPGIGVAELRHAVVAHQKRFYGLDVDPDRQVLVVAGATEGIAATLLSLLELGDEVVAFEPFYDSYAACIAMAGGIRKAVTLRAPDFALDLDALRRAITPRTRLLLLNTPHNPTGKVFSEEEWQRAGCNSTPILVLEQQEAQVVERFLRYWLTDEGDGPIHQSPGVTVEYDF